MASAPLEGLLVVEVANWIAAPSCGALLADLGADVIKVEAPNGDSFRYTQRQPLTADGKPQQKGECIDHGFTVDNRGKRSIAVNLADARGQSLVRKIAEHADVFITNLLPARLAKYGISYAEMDAVNPRIVYASVSGWGLSGPESDKPAFDLTSYFSRGGIMDLMRAPDTPPLKGRSGAGDHQTGLSILSAVLAALLKRSRTGKGSFCETSLLRNATWTLGQDLAPCLVDRKKPPIVSYTEDNPMVRVYRTSDERWLMVCMPMNVDAFWQKMCGVLGWQEWISDERYRSQANRLRHRAQLGAAIQDILLSDTLDSWLRRFEIGGCIAGAVSELPEVVDDPQLRLNGAFQEIHHPIAGTFETVAAPFTIADADVRVRGPAPEPGADTCTVLENLLHLTKDEVDELEASGVVGFKASPNTPLANWMKRVSKL